MQWGAKDYRSPEPGHILTSDFVRTDTHGLMNYQPVKGYEARPRYATTLVVWQEQVKIGSEYFGRLRGDKKSWRHWSSKLEGYVVMETGVALSKSLWVSCV